jgi:ComF family protein
MCECCGFGIESKVDHTFLCSRCRDDPPYFDKARVAGRFRGVLRDLLLNFKYNQGLWLCNDLVDVLHGCVTAYFEAATIDLVVPIPLAPIKQRSRSYNQAGELGRELARRLNRQFSHDALKRVRATATQTRLGASARVANMRGAFDINVPGWVRGRTVLLVDDVMTTGATLNEAARVLRANGATRVWATAVARG